MMINDFAAQYAEENHHSHAPGKNSNLLSAQNKFATKAQELIEADQFISGLCDKFVYKYYADVGDIAKFPPTYKWIPGQV